MVQVSPQILGALATVMVAGFAGAGVFAMQSGGSLPEPLQLQFAMQFGFAGCVCYSLQALVRSAARVERDVQNSSSLSLNCSARLAHMERRMETFTQDGMETARHLEQIFDEYNMEVSGGAVRWAQRVVLEQQMVWSTARNRFGELGSKRAWDLVVESSKRSVKARIADNHSWSNNCKKRIAEETLEPKKAQRLMEESAGYLADAARLKKNMEHLEAHVPLLAGDKDVEDPMKAMCTLMAEFEARKKPEVITAYVEAHCADMFTTGTSFLSRDLQEGYPAAQA